MNNFPVPRSPSDFSILAARYVAAITNVIQKKTKDLRDFNGFAIAFFLVTIVAVFAYQLDWLRFQWRYHPTRIPATSLTKRVEQLKKDEAIEPISQTAPPSVSFNLAPADVQELPEPNVRAFIKQWEKTAVAEMDKFGIPASITMAQGIIESRSGASILAQPSNFATFDKSKVLRQGCNNLFGIKCHERVGSCRPGHCANHMDDYAKDFFIKFKTPEDSWRGHSEFLLKYRYKSLLAYGKNYKAWAKGLTDYGYATDKTYGKKLIAIIEKYELNRLDDL